MVLFLLSKAFYPCPTDCDDKVADVKQMCGVYAPGGFLPFPKKSDQNEPPGSATRDLEVVRGRENEKKTENRITYPNISKCHFLSV